MKLLVGLTFCLALVTNVSGRLVKADEAADQKTVDDKSVADAGRSLGRWWRFPWYDSKTDDIRAILIEKQNNTPNVQPPTNWSLLSILGWAAIAVVLAALVWLIVSAVRNYSGTGSSEAVAERVATRVDHVEALPFMRQRSLDDLLGQARECYLAENYDEAIIFLFSYELVELDRRSLIRLSAGKTNRQYLRELGGRTVLAGLLGQTMVAFEDVYFGNRQLNRRRFENCWNRLAEFEALVASAGEQAGGKSPVMLEAVAPLAEVTAERI